MSYLAPEQLANIDAGDGVEEPYILFQALIWK